tara:strand:+ start:9341 stop:9760 length:420 start_codon:yes stop_codon:yes gene_type:complete
MTKNIKFSNSELIDKLTVSQIKQVINNKNYKEFEKGISSIIKEIDLNIRNKKIYLDSTLINLIIALSQINTFIWLLRDKVSVSNKNLDNNIKLSHQLNALRNKVKNRFIICLDGGKDSQKKTNVNKEDLKGWKYSIVED